MVGTLCSMLKWSSDVIHSVGGRPSKRVYKPGRPPKGSFHQTHPSPLTFCQKEKVVAPHGFSNCPVILKSCRLLVYMVTSVANHIVCYTDHLSDLDTIHPPSEIALETYVQWLCKTRIPQASQGPHWQRTSHFKPAPLDLSDLLNQPVTVTSWQLSRPGHLPNSESEDKRAGEEKILPRDIMYHVIHVFRISSHSLWWKLEYPVGKPPVVPTVVPTELLEVGEWWWGCVAMKWRQHEDSTNREKLVEGIKFSVAASLGIQSVLMIPFHKLRIMKT